MIKVLDLFCGAGGVSMGAHLALPDAEITGVDIAPQKHYPFRFIQADALTFPLDGYDLILASPPCQQYTALRRRTGKSYPDLIAPVRARLQAWGGVWIIENVPGAPLENAIMLCGAQFGLKVYRHRLFETSHYVMAMAHGPHRDQSPGTKGKGPRISPKGFISVVGSCGGNAGYARRAMGIDWMSRDELSQAIPPKYSEYLVKQLAGVLTARAA